MFLFINYSEDCLEMNPDDIFLQLINMLFLLELAMRMFLILLKNFENLTYFPKISKTILDYNIKKPVR